jgi:hypothetical protein
MAEGPYLAMDFEMVLKRYLTECDEHTFHAAGFYNTDLFATRAILFTICMKEDFCNSSKYNWDQREQMGQLRKRLADPSELWSAVNDCVIFLKALPY